MAWLCNLLVPTDPSRKGFGNDSLAMLQVSTEAPHRVGLPPSNLRDLGDGGTLRSAQHGEYLLLLGALTPLAG